MPIGRDHHLVSNSKRSYKPAVRRAENEGYAWFRGKLYDAKALGTCVRLPPKSRRAVPATLPHPRPTHRLEEPSTSL